jgi:tripartite motif-containing protein 71
MFSTLPIFLMLISNAADLNGDSEYVLTGEWLSSCNPLEISRGCTLDEIRPFVYPTGIAFDSSNQVYIIDLWTDTIQKFTSDGKFLSKWGSRGIEDGQFLLPSSIALDSSGNVYVADLARRDIQKFTGEGRFLTKWGARGSEDGQFNNPIDLRIDKENNVFVLDQLNRRIQKFTNEGEFLAKWGSYGTSDGQFLNPKSIALDSEGNVFVLDQNANLIQKFTDKGKFIMKWGSKCQNILAGAEYIHEHACANPADGEFYYPSGGISLDSEGNVFVLDQHNNRIQKFTNDGKFITKWNLPGYNFELSSTSLVGHPDLEIDSENRIFTTAFNDKVLIYAVHHEPITKDTSF